jgi:hypothetical protein
MCPTSTRLLFVLPLLVAACSDDSSNPNGPAAGGGVNDVPPLDLVGVVWLDQDVSGWTEGVNMSAVTFPQTSVCLHHNLDGLDWSTAFVNDEVVANAWVFLEHDGQWHASIWHWLKAEPSPQECMARSDLNGGAINIPPLNQLPFDPPDFWIPQSGELLYYMVSGFAREGLVNVEQRSNIVGAYWP